MGVWGWRLVRRFFLSKESVEREMVGEDDISDSIASDSEMIHRYRSLSFHRNSHILHVTVHTGINGGQSALDNCAILELNSHVLICTFLKKSNQLHLIFRLFPLTFMTAASFLPVRCVPRDEVTREKVQGKEARLRISELAPLSEIVEHLKMKYKHFSDLTIFNPNDLPLVDLSQPVAILRTPNEDAVTLHYSLALIPPAAASPPSRPPQTLPAAAAVAARPGLVDAGVQTEDERGDSEKWRAVERQMETRIGERLERRILERHGQFLQTVLAGLGRDSRKERDLSGRGVCGDCGRVVELTRRAKKMLEKLRGEFGVVERAEVLVTCKMTEMGNCEGAISGEAVELGRGVVVQVLKEAMQEEEEKSLSEISRKLEECDAAWLLGERRLSIVLAEADFVIDGPFVVRSRSKKKIHL